MFSSDKKPRQGSGPQSAVRKLPSGRAVRLGIPALTLAMVVVSIIATIATVAANSHSFVERSIREQHDIVGSLAASNLVAGLSDGVDERVEAVLRRIAEFSSIAGAVLFDPQDRVLLRQPEDYDISAPILEKVMEGVEVRRGGGIYRAWTLRDPQGDYQGRLVVQATLEPMRAASGAAIFYSVLFVAPFLLAILGLFAWQVMKGYRTLCLATRMHEESERAKDHFLSSISHELRTPLTNISSFAELLRLSDSGQSEESREFLQIIDGECRRLSWVVDEVLTFTSLQTDEDLLRQEVADVPATVRAILQLQQVHAGRRHVEVEGRVAEGPHFLELHKKALLTVTVRLLDNAIKFTPEGGRVLLEARHQSARLVVAVHDMGRGVPPEEREAMFEPLQQLGDVLTDKPAGAGMGLAICRAILELVGGEIWYEPSAELGGAKMCFSLPATAKEGSGTFRAVSAKA